MNLFLKLELLLCLMVCILSFLSLKLFLLISVYEICKLQLRAPYTLRPLNIQNKLQRSTSPSFDILIFPDQSLMVRPELLKVFQWLLDGMRCILVVLIFVH